MEKKNFNRLFFESKFLKNIQKIPKYKAQFLKEDHKLGRLESIYNLRK